METITMIMVLSVAITVTMFDALVRQTMRAERALAALARIEATLADCTAAATEVRS